MKSEYATASSKLAMAVSTLSNAAGDAKLATALSSESYRKWALDEIERAEDWIAQARACLEPHDKNINRNSALLNDAMQAANSMEG